MGGACFYDQSGSEHQTLLLPRMRQERAALQRFAATSGFGGAWPLALGTVQLNIACKELVPIVLAA